jgi:hypothetical protein
MEPMVKLTKSAVARAPCYSPWGDIGLKIFLLLIASENFQGVVHRELQEA